MRSQLLLASVIVNFAAFVLATGTLYALGLRVLRDEKRARIGAYFFALTPAGIFMTAAYSERRVSAR